MVNSAVADPPKEAEKSENKGPNKGGTRASQILEQMSRFEDEIKIIKDRWETYERAGKEALSALLDMGEKLAVVRKWLDERNDALPKERGIAWEQWCKKNLPFGKRQADRYRRIYRNKGKIKFTENERVSVRAVLSMIDGSAGGGTGRLRPVGKGKSDIKSKIEAGPTGSVSAGTTGHQIRLTWRDDEIGKSLSKKGEKAVAPDETDMLATACAKLFGFTLNSKHGDLGRRVCDVIRQLPSAPQDADALEAVIQRMEFALIGPANIGGNGNLGATGPTGATGQMGLSAPTGMTSRQLVGAGEQAAG